MDQVCKSLFPKENELKLHTEGGQSLWNVLGAVISAQVTHAQCVPNTLAACSPSLPHAPMVTHSDSPQCRPAL